MKVNGSLELPVNGSGKLKNLNIEVVQFVPADDVGNANLEYNVDYNPATQVGRLIYVTTDSKLYYGQGVIGWTPVGADDASGVDERLDAIIATIGAAATNESGEYNIAAFTGATIINDATSLTNALLQLDTAVSTAASDLNGLTDVTLSSVSTGQILIKSAGDWVNHTLVLADVTDVTASAAEVNILDGATLSTAELNYVDGVTSAIQDQLDNKQPLDATLTALAAFNTDGILVQTGADTFAGRTLTAPAAGITITNPAGIAGSPTFALANDLAALEGLATTGFVVRTGDGTATTREVTGTAGRVVVTDGDGVDSDANVDLATVSDSGTGTFLKVSVDGYGRVTGTQAVATGDITALVDSTYVNVGGDTMTGNLNLGGFSVTGLADPSGGTDATNKNYVDALVSGLSWKQAVRAATTAPVSLATDLEDGDVLDGVTLATGDRVLVKDQADPIENGIYVVQASGAAVRATDANTGPELINATVFVDAGTANADSGWTQTSTVATVGTDGIVWVQFTGAGTYSAGTGLALSGNTFNINLGAGIVELPSDEVGIDLYAPTTGAIILTDNGTARATTDSSKLHLLLPAGSGLAQDVTGLYVPADGITNAMLANDSIILNADNGTGVLALGGTLLVAGDSVQGIVTEVDDYDPIINISALDASASQKGVASFDATEFTVTAGDVELGTVPYTKLSVSTITFAGDSGSDTVGLNETVTFDGNATQGVSTSVATNTVSITVADATVSTKGVASFADADFTVTAGEVTLDPLALDDLSDVVIATPATGQAVIYNGSEFVNKAFYYLHSAGSALTTHTVTHNLGQQYCNVTVVDETDNVVIPESIVFDTANQLTVTFTVAVQAKIVVMGV